jgi:hypothetical protein
LGAETAGALETPFRNRPLALIAKPGGLDERQHHAEAITLDIETMKHARNSQLPDLSGWHGRSARDWSLYIWV